MNTEQICFRLTIVVALGSLLVFGATWSYMTWQVYRKQASLDLAYERMLKTQDECFKDRTSMLCDSYWQESFDRWVKARDEASALADRLGALAISLPLAAIALFYSLRWAFIGRVRPLWLLGRREPVAGGEDGQ